MSQLNFSARAYHRILKLARTIADLAEALQYCPKLIYNIDLFCDKLHQPNDTFTHPSY